jgi:general secretion pathway protein E
MHITDQTDGAVLREHALKEGMTPLRIAGCKAIAAGQTSVEEVLSAAPLVSGVR